MVILGTIDGSLYGRVLGYPSMDLDFLWHIDIIYIGAVHMRIILEKYKNWNFGKFLKNGDFGDLGSCA